MSALKGNKPKYLNENRTEFVDLEKFAIWYALEHNKPVPDDLSLWMDNKDIVEILQEQMNLENSRRVVMRSSVATLRVNILNKKEYKNPELRKQRLSKGFHSSKSQSIKGIKGGNKNKETGWWDTFIKMGLEAAHAPASCKYCGLDSTRSAITKDHDKNCNQKPNIIMPMLNALPKRFLTGMLIPYFDNLGLGETLQRTIENSKWFKPVDKIRTYTIFERGENYYKYINEYPNTTYEPITLTPKEWCDKITDKVIESQWNNILNDAKSLYKILPNLFTYKEACVIVEDHDYKHASLKKIIDSRHLLSIHNKNHNTITYSKNQKVIKTLKDLEPGLTQKQKTDNYKKMVSELSGKFMLESNKIDVNKMYDHVLLSCKSDEIGSFENKQKLTRALEKLGLELEFINRNHDNEIREKYIKILNAIESDEFTANDFKSAVKLLGIKKISQSTFLNNEKYCFRIHEGVIGSKFNVPRYKKIKEGLDLDRTKCVPVK